MITRIIKISTGNCRVVKVSTSPVITVSNGGFDPIWYTADGTEGNILLLDSSPDLTGRTVTAVNRENYELMPTDDFPNSKQFQWAGETPTLTVSHDFEAGEQIKITYK
jgi:hypothetical protein